MSRIGRKPVPVPANVTVTIDGSAGLVTADEPVMRAHFITRTSEGQWDTVQPWDTVAPRLLNFPEPSRFNF